jgi:hypothetical protein
MICYISLAKNLKYDNSNCCKDRERVLSSIAGRSVNYSLLRK